jgi:hypothetical protein
MLDPQCRNRAEPEELAASSRPWPARIVFSRSTDRVREPELADAVRDLPNLLSRMGAGVAPVGLSCATGSSRTVRPEVSNGRNSGVVCFAFMMIS